MLQFPKNFLWGAATSAYQVEGGNFNCDWRKWEQSNRDKEPAGQACRHYELYAEDFAQAANLSHNVHRLSLEWSRIQPEEGKFSQPALDHYQKVIHCLRENRLEPVVTLHHFTNPLWFAELGGWANKRAVGLFLDFTKKIVECFGADVSYWITINEPSVYIYYSYIQGDWPPQERSIFKARRVEHNIFRAHVQAYRLIHCYYREKNLPDPMVGLASNLQAFVPCVSNIRNKISAFLRDKWYNFGLLDRVSRHKAMDYIGVNYYSRNLVEVNRLGLVHFLSDTCQKGHQHLEKNSLGWDIYPQGLYGLLIKLKKYRLPVIITENGICTQDDKQRWRYIAGHLKFIHQAINEGADVRGYLYWSLLDNFEWDKGFGPRFGLIEVDYKTYQRRVRESARKFAAVCKTGMLDGPIE